MAKNPLSCGAQCSKITLITLNIIFLLCGIAMLIIGLMFRFGSGTMKDDIEDMFDFEVKGIDFYDLINSLAIIFIVAGAIVIFFSILGFFGAACEMNACLMVRTGNKHFKGGKYAEAIKCYTEALAICPQERAYELSTFYANRAAAYEKLHNFKEVVENCNEALKLNNKYLKALTRRANACEQLGELTQSLEDVTAICILEGFQNQTTLVSADRVLKELGKTKAKVALKDRKPSMPSHHFIRSYFATFTQDPVQKSFPTPENINTNAEQRAVQQVEDTITLMEQKLNTDEATDFQKSDINLDMPMDGSGDSQKQEKVEVTPDEVTLTEETETEVTTDEVSVTEESTREVTTDETVDTPKVETEDETADRVADDVQTQENHIPMVSPFRTAVEKLEKELYEEIIPLCTLEIDQSPASDYRLHALLLRGTIYGLMGQRDEALADFDSLLNIEDLDRKIKVNVLIKRGGLNIQREQQTEGLADFAMAVKIDQDNSDIYHHRGHQNIQLDKLEEAIQDFETSITKNPDFPASYIQKSYAEHRRAAVEQSTMKLEKAIRSYETTLKRFPDCADGHALYAQALCDLGRFDDADKEFETAIKQEPDNANTYVHRALLKLQWKQSIDESIALVKKAIEIDAKCEYAYEILGTIEVQRGDMVQSVDLFNKAIELCRTETEMAHLFSLLHAAQAQLKAAQMLGIPLPAHFSPMS